MMGSHIGRRDGLIDLPFEAPDPLLSAARPETLLLFKLKRRVMLIAAVTLASFTILAVAFQFLPPTYEAISSVMVESRTPRPPVRGSEVLPEPMPVPFGEDVIGTEMSVLGSREIMIRVTQELHLVDDPHFNRFLKPGFALRAHRAYDALLAPYLPNQPGMLDGSSEQQFADTVDALIAAVKLVPVPRSRVIEIRSTTWNPELSAKISNLIARFYVDTHLGTTHELNVEAQKFLTRRLTELQVSSTKAAEAVEQYRIENGLVSNGSNTYLQEQVATLERQVLEARDRLATAQAQYDTSLTTDPEKLPGSVNSPTLAKLREFEATEALRRADILARFGPHSPQLASVNFLVTTAKAQVQAEAARQRDALKLQVQDASATVASLSARLADVRGQLAKTIMARAQLSTLEAESNAAQGLYSAFVNRSMETDADLFFPSTDVRIVSQATAPTRPSFPRNIYTLPVAGVLALALGMSCAFVVESRRKGLTSPEEAQAALRKPVLGLLPTRNRATEGVYLDLVEDLFNRVYHGLGARSVLITSPLPREGKSSTAQALADAATGRGLKVLLVDADLRSVADSRRTRDTSKAGLSEVLSGELDASDALLAEPRSSLAVLPSGRAHANPTRLLSLPETKLTIAALAEQFEFVIIDGPAAITSGDCWILSQHVDHTLMVARWGETPAKTILAALRQIGSEAVGIVLNMVDPRESRRLGVLDAVMFSPELARYRRS